MEDKMDIKDMLEEEIRSEIISLSKMEPGSRTHSDAIDSVAKLYKLHIETIESERAFIRRSDEFTNQDLELKLKAAQLDNDVKSRYFRFGAEMAGIVLPLVFYGVWMNRGFKFEENGTFTSTTFRGLFSKFRPR